MNNSKLIGCVEITRKEKKKRGAQAWGGNSFVLIFSSLPSSFKSCLETYRACVLGRGAKINIRRSADPLVVGSYTRQCFKQHAGEQCSLFASLGSLFKRKSLSAAGGY